MDSPFTITMYDKAFQRIDWLDEVMEVTVTPRHNAIGTASVMVASDHRSITDLTTPGTRLVFSLNDEQILSGPIRNWDGTGPEAVGTYSFTVEDDLRVLWNMNGYPSPAQPTETQNAKEDARTGPAETVAKAYVTANKGRWASILPITVAASLGRGSSITTAIRMLPLTDKLLPAVDKAGIGMSMKQSGSGLRFDCYVPTVYPLILTEDSGTVVDYTISNTPITATRAIIGGPNEGTSREFKLVIDAVREALYGDIIEILVDAGSEETTAKMLAKGTEALADAGPKYGANVTLSETSVFHYGGTDGLHVGDMVSVELAEGVPPITEVLREAALTFNRESGFSAAMKIGDSEEDQDQTPDLIQQIARAVRDSQSR